MAVRVFGMAALAATVWSCEQAESSGVLVRIDDIAIGEEDLALFESKLPDYFASPFSGERRVRDLLQSMVDRELMVLESEARGYVKIPRVQRRLNQILSKWLVDRVVSGAGRERVQVSEKEAREVFEARGLGKGVLLARIVCATEGEAMRVVAMLQAGGDFAGVAQEESEAADAVLGGDMRRYFGYSDLPAAVREAAWGLETGDFTPEPVALREGFGVFKILDIKRRPFEAMAPSILESMGRQKVMDERRRLVSTWEERLQVSYDGQVIAAILASDQSVGDVSHEDSQMALATYEGGRLLFGDALRGLRRNGRLLGGLTDSLRVVEALRSRALGDSMLVQAARTLGLDREAEFVELRKMRRRELLARELWRHEARDKVDVSEDDVRQVYRDSVHKYTEPGQAEVVEILVAGREEAEELMGRIAAGEDMELLAVKHTRRTGEGEQAGRLHIHETDDELAPLYIAASRAAPGDLVGPLEVTGGVSIFRPIAIEPQRPRPFEKIAGMIRLEIRKRRERATFESFLKDLRARYRDRVIWFDENIRRRGVNSPSGQ